MLWYLNANNKVRCRWKGCRFLRVSIKKHDGRFDFYENDENKKVKANVSREWRIDCIQPSFEWWRRIHIAFSKMSLRKGFPFAKQFTCFPISKNPKPKWVWKNWFSKLNHQKEFFAFSQRPSWFYIRMRFCKTSWLQFKIHSKFKVHIESKWINCFENGISFI